MVNPLMLYAEAITGYGGVVDGDYIAREKDVKLSFTLNDRKGQARLQEVEGIVFRLTKRYWSNGGLDVEHLFELSQGLKDEDNPDAQFLGYSLNRLITEKDQNLEPRGRRRLPKFLRRRDDEKPKKLLGIKYDGFNYWVNESLGERRNK